MFRLMLATPGPRTLKGMPEVAARQRDITFDGRLAGSAVGLARPEPDAG